MSTPLALLLVTPPLGAAIVVGAQRGARRVWWRLWGSRALHGRRRIAGEWRWVDDRLVAIAVPPGPGQWVYRHLDRHGRQRYVGRTNNLAARFRQHADAKALGTVHRFATWSWITTPWDHWEAWAADDEHDARRLEDHLIRALGRPAQNHRNEIR